jgi:23S rRNA-/tRNA-specific pseudouridylate synthase
MQYIENDQYYFVRKPHGIPTTFGSQFSFLEQLEQERDSFFEQQSKEFNKAEEYGLLNRLDNDTAGYIYFAKTHKAKDAYLEKQQAKQYTKYYIAIVA